jgi:hypothetical protein
VGRPGRKANFINKKAIHIYNVLVGSYIVCSALCIKPYAQDLGVNKAHGKDTYSDLLDLQCIALQDIVTVHHTGSVCLMPPHGSSFIAGIDILPETSVVFPRLDVSLHGLPGIPYIRPLEYQLSYSSVCPSVSQIHLQIHKYMPPAYSHEPGWWGRRPHTLVG